MSYNPKMKYGQAVSEVLRKAADVMDAAPDLLGEWFAAGYNASITDEDLEQLGFTKAELDAAIVFLEQADKFLHNNSPADADYSQTVNKFKRTI